MLVQGREIRDAYKRELAWSEKLAADLGFADQGSRDLAGVVDKFRPTVLIGTSGQAGAFTEAVVKQMAKTVEWPVIMPFSNPTDYAEAIPSDVLRWTDGRALIATGSPFPPVAYDGRLIEIGQGNNVFIFPGLGLGALLSGVAEISDAMISASAHALAHAVSDAELQRGLLFPAVNRLRDVSAAIATAVIKQAAADGNCELPDADVERYVQGAMWQPRYPEYIAV